MEKTIFICPKCGSHHIHVESLQQYSKITKVNKDGTLSKRSKMKYIGPEGLLYITCDDCGLSVSSECGAEGFNYFDFFKTNSK